MTTIFKIVAIITLGILLYRVIKDSIQRNITGYVNYDRNQYELIIGEDATQIFKRYKVDSMHGLSLDGAISSIAEGGTYIDGLSNYHPADKKLDMALKPFLFLNLSSMRNNYSNDEICTLVMHECMHMSGKLYNGCWDSHEEEMITWAEKEANEIIKLLKKNKFI
jgi:hypothetical protein